MHYLDEHLVGYLLDALEEDLRREVEVYLQSSPEAREKLDRLRDALQPLELDRADPVPPAGLVEGTLAVIRASRIRSRAAAVSPEPVPPVPHAPRVPPNQVVPRSWWRRSDVAAASVLLLVGLGVAMAWVGGAWRSSEQTVCQDNLRQYHRALVHFAEQRGEGAFPRVEREGPRGFAATFVPVLLDAGVLTEKAIPVCPSHGKWTPPEGIDRLANLEDWYRKDRARFEQVVANLSACYAYSLGYREENGHLCGLRQNAGLDLQPIMADRPPFSGQGTPQAGNSLSHQGRGQNVLLVGGSVRFVTTRTMGAGGDDIYLNQDRRVLAGLGQTDSVLGSNNAAP